MEPIRIPEPLDPFEGLIGGLDRFTDVRRNRSRFGSFMIISRGEQLRLDLDAAGLDPPIYQPYPKPVVAAGLLPVTLISNAGNKAVTRRRRILRKCAECDNPVYASRSDALYCSGRCRIRAWRAAQAGR